MIFTRSDLLSLGTGLASRLTGGGMSFNGEGNVLLKGDLSLLPFSNIEVPCRIEISERWKSKPPSVLCAVGWIRQHIDWHVFEDGSLCYVLPHEWADNIRAVSGRHDIVETVEYATEYLIRNTKWLLQHHWDGYRQGMTEWQWPQWRHFEFGPRQYREERYRASRTAS